MKVLIIQSDGEHKGQDSYCRNDYLRECWALKHAFIENGIEDVTVWGKRHQNFKSKIDFNSYDLIFILEQYEFDWLPDFSKITKPKKLQWIIDLHCQSPSVYKKISKDCDVILHSTKSFIEGFKKDLSNKDHVWFPNAVDDRHFKIESNKTEKDHNIIFVGSDIPVRKIWVKHAEENLGMKSMFKTGKDYIEALASTKIHFNKSISLDVNYRNFETIGMGTCLMTNHLDELEELGFVDCVNCIMYKGRDEMREKYDWILEGRKLLGVSMCGYLFSMSHTYTKRIESLI